MIKRARLTKRKERTSAAERGKQGNTAAEVVVAAEAIPGIEARGRGNERTTEEAIETGTASEAEKVPKRGDARGIRNGSGTATANEAGGTAKDTRTEIGTTRGAAKV